MQAGRTFALLLLAAASQAQQIPFKLEIDRPVLSNHQRLVATINVKIDGADIVRRLGEGDLTVKMDIHDQQGHVYRTGGKIDLRGARKDTRKANLFYSEDVFVMPGNYQALVRIVDAVSGQEGSAEKDFKVDPLGGDPLPEMWRDLPAVEFAPAGDGPEQWFLPSVEGRLHLPLETKRPVKVDLLVNTTPTEFHGGPERQNGINMSTVMPAMKAIFQTEVRNGSLEMALLDLAKLKVVYSQDNRNPLDWPQLKSSLEAANPNVIDLHSLANRTRDGDYFVYEVGQRVRAALKPGEPMHVLIVLSGPMNFPAGVLLHRVDVRETERCKVFYIRYLTQRAPVQFNRPTGAVDEIEFMLTPVRPHKFEVGSPMEFRKALASILTEVSQLP
jgi:hypothetical protein